MAKAIRSGPFGFFVSGICLSLCLSGRGTGCPFYLQPERVRAVVASCNTRPSHFFDFRDISGLFVTSSFGDRYGFSAVCVDLGRRKPLRGVNFASLRHPVSRHLAVRLCAFPPSWERRRDEKARAEPLSLTTVKSIEQYYGKTLMPELKRGGVSVCLNCDSLIRMISQDDYPVTKPEARGIYREYSIMKHLFVTITRLSLFVAVLILVAAALMTCGPATHSPPQGQPNSQSVQQEEDGPKYPKLDATFQQLVQRFEAGELSETEAATLAPDHFESLIMVTVDVSDNIEAIDDWLSEQGIKNPTRFANPDHDPMYINTWVPVSLLGALSQAGRCHSGLVHVRLLFIREKRFR